jgi:sugar phosphate isomerase/epimerase
MENIKIAAQLYTLRDFLKTPEEIRLTLKRVKDIGYEWIQVSGIGPISHESMREILDETGLKVCATHISYERLQKDMEDVIYQHKLWDVPNIGIGSIPGEFKKDEEGFSKFAIEASKIGKRISEMGFRFTYHNHKFEFQKYNGRTALDIIIEESDKENLDFLLDTYWVQAGGGDSADWIYKLNGRMKVIHFKDMKIIEDKQLMSEIGEGNMNWKSIIKACKDTEVEWIAIEQDDCNGKDPFECLKISYENTKKMLTQ